ncbi:MAG: hypothetical protein MI753_15685 [Hyphomicrobiales bacterium]|nr:hypothetical protein [Hyphomicrobiales bacterium]
MSVIRFAKRSAAVPKPGKFFTHALAIFNSRRFCAIAGVAKAGAAIPSAAVPRKKSFLVKVIVTHP